MPPSSDDAPDHLPELPGFDDTDAASRRPGIGDAEEAVRDAAAPGTRPPDVSIPDAPGSSQDADDAAVAAGTDLDEDDEFTGRMQPLDEEDEQDDSDPGLPGVISGDREPVATSTAHLDPNIGKRFGNFEITERIGRGGMGTVYKGKQVSLDREVAIKILNAQLVNNVEFIRRFQREAKSIARISHPNIVGVHDFGENDGLYFMIIEYVKGTNLSRMINERLVLTIEDFLPILVQCLEGLEYVARTGIVHRDIKPDNILITEENVAKIADFGLAKNTEAGVDTDLTAHGSAMGTPAYMSPEQCMGRQLDFRSDIYAFGVTAYFALTGEKPFTGKSSFEIMTRHREYMPPPAASLNPQLPGDISDEIMRMLAKDPNDRYHSVMECRDRWLDLCEQHNLINMHRKSGEWNAPEVPGLAPELAPQPETPARTPSSLDESAVPSPVAAEDLQPMMPDLPSVPEQERQSPSFDGDPFAEADGRGGVGAESQTRERPSTSVRSSRSSPSSRIRRSSRRGRAQESERIEAEHRRQSATLAPTTCPACGMLNKGSDISCQRCGGDLVDPNTLSFEEREWHADQLMRRQQYKDAAQAYGRLADSVSGRRQRSVLRSKEREARTRHEDELFSSLAQRSRDMAQRGDIVGGISMLKRGLDDSATSPALTARLTTELNALEAKRRRRRRRLFLGLVLLVIAAGLAALWYYQARIPGLVEVLPEWLLRVPPALLMR